MQFGSEARCSEPLQNLELSAEQSFVSLFFESYRFSEHHKTNVFNSFLDFLFFERLIQIL